MLIYSHLFFSPSKTIACGFALILALAPPLSALAAPTSVQISGSSTIAPLANSLAKEFEKKHPARRIDVQTGGSSKGISDVRRGLADIGMVSRTIRASDRGIQAHPIARDGIAFIVHQDNPLTAIRSADAKKIYRKQITLWSDLGVSLNAPITVVHKSAGRSTQEVFLKYFGIKNSQVRPDLIIGENEQGIKTVAGNPAAIGYVSIGAAEVAVRQGSPLRILALDGIPASTQTVRDQTYPLSRTLNFITKVNSQQKTKDEVRDFLEFSRSPSVSDVIRRHYFVPL